MIDAEATAPETAPELIPQDEEQAARDAHVQSFLSAIDEAGTAAEKQRVRDMMLGDISYRLISMERMTLSAAQAFSQGGFKGILGMITGR